MQYTELGRTGFRVSKLGLGGAPLGGDYGPTTDEQAVAAVHAAIDAGINFFDTAPLYGSGHSERRLGLALEGRRSGVFVATKAINRTTPHTYENTIRSVEESLRRLQTDYIDLIQLHESENVPQELAMNETIPAFQKLKEQGKVRAIGVNAGKMEVLLPFIRAGLCDTIQTFGRYTLLDQTAREELFPVTREYGIGVIHGSPLSMGLLADRPAPFLMKYDPMLQEAKRRLEQLAFLRMGGEGGLVEAAMRFSLTCPDIAVTLTGSVSPEEIARNASYADGAGLSDDEMARVLSLFPGQKLFG